MWKLRRELSMYGVPTIYHVEFVPRNPFTAHRLTGLCCRRPAVCSKYCKKKTNSQLLSKICVSFTGPWAVRVGKEENTFPALTIVDPVTNVSVINRIKISPLIHDNKFTICECQKLHNRIMYLMAYLPVVWIQHLTQYVNVCTKQSENG